MAHTFRLQTLLSSIVVLTILSLMPTALEGAAVQDPCAWCGDSDEPPIVDITPGGGSFGEASLEVTINWCDDNSLGTHQITFNGEDVTSSFEDVTSGSNPCPSGYDAWKQSQGTVTLLEGSNTLQAEVCDLANQCSSDTASYTLDTQEPTASIAPSGGTFSSASLDVTVDWCDDRSLNGSTRELILNGNDVTSDFTYVDGSESCGSSKTSSGTLDLSTGDNIFTATIQDQAGNTASESVSYTYEDLVAPEVSLAPHSGSYRDVANCAVDCFDATVSYSTPAYTSLDQTRSATLIYRSAQAAPGGMLELDVHRPPGSLTPDRFSLRLQRSDGSWVTFANGSTEMFWDATGEEQRLAVQFEVSEVETYAYDYTAVVKSWLGSSVEETTRDVRVLVVDERQSPYGAGWSVAGLQRLHSGFSGDIVVTEGDGSVLFFEQQTSTSWRAPVGDFTELVETDSTFERRYLDGTVFTFSLDGLLLRAEDRYGNATTYAYDGGGRLTAITDPAQKQITFGYGSDGKLAWIEDAGGRRSTVTIDAAGDLTAIQDPGGEYALQATYDADHRMRTRTDRSGGTWSLAYDFAGKLAADTLPEITTESGLERPAVAFRAPVSAALVDPASGAGSDTMPAPALASHAVEGWTEDTRGNRTTVRVDGFGAPLRVDPPGQGPTVFTRNDTSQVTRTDLPEGGHVSFTWDGPDLTQITDARESPSRTVSITYTSTFHQPDTISGDVPERVFHYGSRGELDSLEVKSGQQTVATMHFTYDARGRPDTITDPEGHTTTFGYQSSGWKNTAWIEQDKSRTSFEYGAYGRRERTITPEGDTTQVAYDDLNRVTRTTDPEGNEVLYRHGLLYLDEVEDALAQTYTFDRNALGWVTKRTDPRGYSDDYVYDVHGQVQQWTDRRTRTVSFGYDSLGVLTSRTADGTTTTFATDPDGDFVAASNPASTDTVYFDDAGRATEQVTFREESGETYRLQMSYNDFGQRTKLEMISPWTRSIEYGYDAASRLDSIVDVTGDITHLLHNADHQVRQIRFPTGDTLFKTYPSTHRPGRLRWNDSELYAAFGLSYEQDLQGRMTDVHPAGSDTTRHYEYDPAGRLWGYEDLVLEGEITCTTDGDPDAYGTTCTSSTDTTTAATVSYGYDAVGNRTDSGAQVATGNRLTAFDGYTLEWDNAGYLERKYDGDLDQRFYWSATGRLDSISTNGAVTRFTYDGFGRRIEVSSSSGTSEYLYDDDDLFLELDGSGSIAAEYTYYPGIDQPHSMRRDGSQYFYATDHLGSVRGMFNSSGTVQNEYRYAPFGGAESASGTVTNPLRFTAREWDEETNLYYYRNRYYDPAIARFISEDPIGLEGGINPYTYVGNDPVNRRDPLGLDPCLFPNDNGGWRESECELEELVVTVSRILTIFVWVAPWEGGSSTPRGNLNPTPAGHAGPGFSPGAPLTPPPAAVDTPQAADECSVEGVLEESRPWAVTGAALGTVSGGYVGATGGSIPFIYGPGVILLPMAPMGSAVGGGMGSYLGGLAGYKLGQGAGIVFNVVENCVF